MTTMTAPIRVAAVIPARMASTRLPGKPLLSIRGLPMIEHVRRRALACRGFCDVVVATCDPEIAETVRHFGGTVIMSSPTHAAATDRVAEAAGHLACTHVVNVQGDEVLVLPRDLERFVEAIERQPEIAAWNAVARIEEEQELGDPGIVKCLVSVSGRLLCCSRDFSRLPPDREGAWEPVRKVLGILGYRCDFLQRYGRLDRTPLERAQAIDQSRIVEHDVVLQGVEFSRGYPGINEPRDVAIVERYLEEDPAQQALLQELVCKVG